MDMIQFEEIIRKFQIEGEITEVHPLGHGSVNHTYEIVCGGIHYVLQEMNHFIFKYPTDVMNNLFHVTEYLRDIIEREGRDPDLETLTFIRTKAGNQLLQTETGSYFRLYRMIRFGEEMKKPDTAETAYEVGKILGQFHRRLRDFPVEQLSYTMPKLHNMNHVLSAFLDAVRGDICFRTSDCQEQIQFVLERSRKTSRIRDAVKAGEIPLRVTHNDTHYSNILVDAESKKAICLIDLDTVMPGVSILDFGDSVRAGAATFDEDEKSGDIELDLDLYRFHLQGYADEMGRVLTDREKELINDAVWLMALERGICYLTDYLNGDRYLTDFSSERQNLYRAVNQFFLVLDIEEKNEQMMQIARHVFLRHGGVL
ncbi:MAG: phosphotransferase [Clostridiales bacterium]|nr:phosphotransferase [Clostridiales bacterium]MCD8133893.1 phosphotransferase [Clostridiales bacterium]